MNQALIAQLYAGFVERYGDDIAAAHREVCERLVASFDAYLAHEAAAVAFTGWCTATTGWTTCCSGSRVPTGR